ncbi:MAG TPA: tyrosine-type recombinase/integrase [Candidatus Hydrogenedentes bacterium]|nr:tyrosine-type recombinase/integrase [Candidatus Hydrogenedentota bacterium]
MMSLSRPGRRDLGDRQELLTELESIFQRTFKRAVGKSDFTTRATCHTLRRNFATHLLESGYGIRTVQKLHGHNDVPTTAICTHVLNRGGKGAKSPHGHPVKKKAMIAMTRVMRNPYITPYYGDFR